MKNLVSLLFMLFSFGAFAANSDWDYVGITNGGVSDSLIYIYDLYGYPRGCAVSTEGPLSGYETTDGFFLKQRDHKTTPVPVDNNIWVLAFYGELLNDETIEKATRIPLVDWEDYSTADGVLVAHPSDFYLGFKATGSNAYDGVDRFGWYHVSVDDSLEMTLLDAGVGFYGEAVLVGIGSIPEPTGTMLALVGMALLALRRKCITGG